MSFSIQDKIDSMKKLAATMNSQFIITHYDNVVVDDDDIIDDNEKEICFNEQEFQRILHNQFDAQESLETEEEIEQCKKDDEMYEIQAQQYTNMLKKMIEAEETGNYDNVISDYEDEEVDDSYQY